MNMKNYLNLFLCAAAVCTLGACSENENMPGGAPAGSGIPLIPAVSADSWNTPAGALTRAGGDTDLPVLLAEGGELKVRLLQLGTDGTPDGNSAQQNRFQIDADGKLVRLAESTEKGDTHQDLNVPEEGDYYFNLTGLVNCTLDNIPLRGFIDLKGKAGAEGDAAFVQTVGKDGKVTFASKFVSAALRVVAKSSDKGAYAGSDITVTLQNQTDYNNAPAEVKTLTAAAPTAIWGDLLPEVNHAKDTEVMRIAVDGKTYKVLSPGFNMLARRLYTFNVLVGATGVVGVELESGTGVADFTPVEVVPAEAEALIPPSPIAEGGKVYSLNGYWVTAPEVGTKTYPWNSDTGSTAASNLCDRRGGCWRLPTMKDFEAMAGWTVIWPYSDEVGTDAKDVLPDKEAWSAAFPSGSYWSSTVRASDSKLGMIRTYVGNVNYNWAEKSTPMSVRCVWRQDEDHPLYNGQEPVLLDIPNCTPYYVAPENVVAGDEWNNIDFDNVCPEGWYVPTKEDFLAMTGLTVNTIAPDNFAAISAAFPVGIYWSSSSTDEERERFAWTLGVNGEGTSYIDRDEKEWSGNQVRCVRIKG